MNRYSIFYYIVTIIFLMFVIGLILFYLWEVSPIGTIGVGLAILWLASLIIFINEGD